MAKALRLATLNLLNDLSRWEERRSLVVEGLAPLALDMIALQEVTDPLGSGTAHWLADELGGYSVYVCPKSGRSRTREGVVILSRMPVESHETINLPGQRRTAQLVRVSVVGQPVVVVNTHLYWPPGAHTARVRQVEHLLDWVCTTEPGVEAILCGDFNATPGTPAIERMEQSFTSAYKARHGQEPEWTCPTPLTSRNRVRNTLTRSLLRLFSNRPGLTWQGTLDYIFVGPGMKVSQCEVVLDRPSPGDPTLYASDHLGLAAILEVRGRG